MSIWGEFTSFTMLSFPICEHFSIYVDTILFFSSVLYSSQHVNYIYVVIYLRKSAWVFINEVVFLIFRCSLLVYQNTIDFCRLIYLANSLLSLLKSLVSSRSFLSIPWNFLRGPLCHLQIGAVLFLSFQYLYLLFPFLV